MDFAHKRRNRGPAGWALRNVKLRTSRKLMYAAGLLTCFSCDPALRPVAARHPWYDARQVVEHLARMVGMTPLDIVAGVVLSCFGELSGAGERLFSAYDAFLGLLEGQRAHLKGLLPWEAEGEVYQEARRLGILVQQALTEIFFERDTPLRQLSIRYGVF